MKPKHVYENQYTAKEKASHKKAYRKPEVIVYEDLKAVTGGTPPSSET